jgi:hypothetical protein
MYYYCILSHLNSSRAISIEHLLSIFLYHIRRLEITNLSKFYVTEWCTTVSIYIYIYIYIPIASPSHFSPYTLDLQNVSIYTGLFYCFKFTRGSFVVFKLHGASLNLKTKKEQNSVKTSLYQATTVKLCFHHNDSTRQ